MNVRAILLKSNKAPKSEGGERGEGECVPLLLRFIRLRGRGMAIPEEEPLDDCSTGVLDPELFGFGISITSIFPVIVFPSVYRPCLSRTLSRLTPLPFAVDVGLLAGGDVSCIAGDTMMTSDLVDIRPAVETRGVSRCGRVVSGSARRSPSKRRGRPRVRAGVVIASARRWSSTEGTGFLLTQSL